MENHKIFNMPFSKVFPLLIKKAERKNRTKEEVYTITRWMSGYTDAEIDKACIEGSGVTYGSFFVNMPNPNPNRVLVTGKICGVQVETIEDPIMIEIRRLDKMVDELAKGKSLEKILRK